MQLVQSNGHARLLTPAPTRASSIPNPYNRIEKVPLISADHQSRSRGFSVRIQHPDDPTGWRECGVVGPQFLVVPNADVKALAFEVASRVDGEWSLQKEFFDGRRFVLSLFNRTSARFEVKVGDAVGYAITFVNAYDGSAKLTATLSVVRLSCLNGAMVSQCFKRVTYRHDNSARHWDAETAAALDMIRYADVGLQRFVDAARLLASMRVTSSQLRTIRSEVLDKLPVGLWGQVLDQYLLKEELTGWGLFNALTQRTWHAPKQTATDFQHNEYGSTRLLEFALGGRLG